VINSMKYINLAGLPRVDLIKEVFDYPLNCYNNFSEINITLTKNNTLQDRSIMDFVHTEHEYSKKHQLIYLADAFKLIHRLVIITKCNYN
jgi:hypothetical protein